MRRRLLGALVTAGLVLMAVMAGAQTARPGGDGPEIKLDESTTLKATALEARMAALVANFALLQRQAQDMQQELKQILEDRKKLIEDAAKKGRTDVGDANEWMFDNKGQRYVKIKRAP